MRARGAVPLALALAAACRPGGPRAPEPAALEALVNASVAVTYAAAVEAVSQEGIGLRRADPDLRLVDTEYFDLAMFLPAASNYPPIDRTMRFRITVAADTLGRGALVAIRALYLPFQTSAVYSERNERAIPRGHPGHEFVRRVSDRIRLNAER